MIKTLTNFTFKAPHSQFSTCKRIDPKPNVAPGLKIFGVPRLHLAEVVSARVNEALCQNFGVLRRFLSACKWGFIIKCDQDGGWKLNACTV